MYFTHDLEESLKWGKEEPLTRPETDLAVVLVTKRVGSRDQPAVVGDEPAERDSRVLRGFEYMPNALRRGARY